MTRNELPQVVEGALKRLGGHAPVAKIAEDIWANHERELRGSGDLFYTWQYDMRWAAQRLRNGRKLTYNRIAGQQVWQLI